MREIIHRIHTEQETVEVSEGGDKDENGSALVKLTISVPDSKLGTSAWLSLDERRELVKALQSFDPSESYRGPG